MLSFIDVRMGRGMLSSRVYDNLKAVYLFSWQL
jgi:hypothetical protein